MSEAMRLTELAVNEYRGNRRLQWMLVAVLIILCISSIKWISDAITEIHDDVQRLVDLSARLEYTAAQPFNDELLQESQKTLEQALEVVPGAGSMSTAEAQALKQLERVLGDLIQQKRLNLLGSEEVKSNNTIFWQVRVEISGRLNNKDLIELLAHFDASQPHRRINALRYRPKASNTISLVADFLFRQADNE